MSSSLRERIWSDMRVVEQVRFFFVSFEIIEKNYDKLKIYNAAEQNRRIGGRTSLSSRFDVSHDDWTSKSNAKSRNSSKRSSCTKNDSR